MSIEQIPYQPVPEPPRDALPIGRAERHVEHNSSGFDRSEVSDFGRMLLRSSEELRTGEEPDAERVRQFRQQLDEPVEWSDNVVATMLDRVHA